jgi:uncharacterized protein YbjT (DUF2867 family)
MNRILVIGATGRVGRQVVSQLLDAGDRVRALCRHPESAGLPASVEIAAGDLTLPETLDPALDGADTVFLVWTAPRETVGPALDRITRRAKRVVFLSAPLKTPHPLFQQPNPGAAMTAQIERIIEGSGREFTFLRPGMFASNAVLWWAGQIRAGDVVRWPYALVPTAPIDERDIAAVAVRALREEGHAGAEYGITGPASLTHVDQVAILGEVLGRPLRYEEVARQEWRPPFPPFVANMLANAWEAAMGHPAWMTSTFAEVTGRQPRTFREWATDNAATFR